MSIFTPDELAVLPRAFRMGLTVAEADLALRRLGEAAREARISVSSFALEAVAAQPWYRRWFLLARSVAVDVWHLIFVGLAVGAWVYSILILLAA